MGNAQHNCVQMQSPLQPCNELESQIAALFTINHQRLGKHHQLLQSMQHFLKLPMPKLVAQWINRRTDDEKTAHYKIGRAHV